MNLKFSEILLIVLALGGPIAVFAVVMTPGAREAVLDFALAPANRLPVFGGMAGAIGLIAVWRFMRRFGPEKSQDAPPAPQPADFFWRSRRK